MRPQRSTGALRYGKTPATFGLKIRVVLMLNMDIPRAPFIEIFQQGEFTPCLPNVSRFETEILFFLCLTIYCAFRFIIFIENFERDRVATSTTITMAG